MDSKLQIISGQFRGRKLILPPDARPTQNKARIALFNMLTGILPQHVSSLTVWDAFAGSGAFGLECLSRYETATVVFTDVADSSINTVKKNLGSLNIGARASVHKMSAVDGLEKFAPAADIIFLDPPYAEHGLGVEFVKKAAKLMKRDAVLIWEQDGQNAEDVADSDNWQVIKDKTYGRARFLFLQKM